MYRATLAVALLASAPSCPDLYSLAAHGFTAPTLTSRDATATPAASGLRLQLALGAHNPNSFPIELAGVDYDFAVEGTPAFSGSQKGVTVAQQGDNLVQLAGELPFSSPIFKSLRPGQTAHYALTGTAHVATPAGVPLAVEFATGGTFMVPQVPLAGP